MTRGQELAREDFKKYQSGELTKEELLSAAELAKWYANYGSDEVAGDYLRELGELGFIKVFVYD